MSDDDFLEDMEISSPRPGVIVMNHAPHLCEGEFCCIHNPSPHHMRDWDLVMREQALYCPTHDDPRHAIVLSGRKCPHGFGHPDPDSLGYARRHDPENYGEWGLHFCDLCCHAPTTLPST